MVPVLHRRRVVSSDGNKVLVIGAAGNTEALYELTQHDIYCFKKSYLHP